MLKALDAAHKAGVVHRDVKPANIMMAEDGRILLTDFGIAAHQDDTRLTTVGSVIGTPEYLAPERINSEEARPASDLFALGVTLYQAIEGVPPFKRTSPTASDGDLRPAGPRRAAGRPCRPGETIKLAHRHEGDAEAGGCPRQPPEPGNFRRRPSRSETASHEAAAEAAASQPAVGRGLCADIAELGRRPGSFHRGHEPLQPGVRPTRPRRPDIARLQKAQPAPDEPISAALGSRWSEEVRVVADRWTGIGQADRQLLEVLSPRACFESSVVRPEGGPRGIWCVRSQGAGAS
ncbi:hypothetical protein EOT10_36875 [Streptomyces antnestii]|uniref:non-specific serine/threonine protein kinase n=1 Tax=Streptomyces antnestii TaxID=2494256 RepID=A0A3S2W8F4_9ACTN|nr:hypothetical protein EOT10_36875 [Streptomyces sp. San01]